MTPRRSSRARTTQALQSTSQLTNSSNSSISSTRPDRSARSQHKLSSPQSSNAPRSRSSQEADDLSKPSMRRTRSSEGDTKEDVPIPASDEEEAENEEEVTRCICGNQEYPGMPVPINHNSKLNSKASGGSDTSNASDTPLEDGGGLFIQCDICKVWQHGGCVGIMEIAMSPDEYFCERCRKDLHKITTTAGGQKYSRYLLVKGTTSAQSSPISSSHEATFTNPKDGKTPRANVESLASKRRSTMNSRDAAYDEAEQLRRAIEESKKERLVSSTNVNTRKAKRSRSDSEQRKEDAKRQRTRSDSLTPPSGVKVLAPNLESIDEQDRSARPVGGSHRKSGSVGIKINQSQDIRDREEKREKERAEAVGRRKGRAERRAGDDSDPSEGPTPRTTSSRGANSHLPPANSRIPLAPSPPLSKAPHHKKPSRPPARRGRIGRNQYTKDRDLRPPDSVQPENASPLRSRAHSRSRDADHRHSPYSNNANGNSHTSGSNNAWAWTSITHNSGENGKPSKPRHMNPNRTTMNDMKRRVSGILDFISRTQIEMASFSSGLGIDSKRGEPSPLNTMAGSSGARTRAQSNATTIQGNYGEISDGDGSNDRKSEHPTVSESDLLSKKVNSSNGSSTSAEVNNIAYVSDHCTKNTDPIRLAETALDADSFKSLNSIEMMEVLTRGLMRWQGEFGRIGEK